MSVVTVWQNVVLIAAIVAAGLTAGVLLTYACSVMPGLRRADDKTFVGSFQTMDQAIVSSPPFIAAFVGAPVLAFVAVVLHLGEDHRATLGWAIAALGFALATIGITRVVHLPLNAAIQAVGDPSQHDDLPGVRGQFEQRWVRWNIVRTVTATAALTCLAVALAV